MTFFGWWRMLMAIGWWFEENRYFGWHRVPQSTAELFADGLFWLMLAWSISPVTRVL
jgi:hypothetical protein